MIKSYFSKQFVLFLLAGGFAALVNFASRILINKFINYSTAIIFAYIIGMMIAFILNKLFVFRGSRQSTNRSIIYFVIVNGVAVFQTWGISVLLAYHILPYFGIKSFVQEIAHAIGLGIPIISSYFGHKKLSFK